MPLSQALSIGVRMRFLILAMISRSPPGIRSVRSDLDRKPFRRTTPGANPPSSSCHVTLVNYLAPLRIAGSHSCWEDPAKVRPYAAGGGAMMCFALAIDEIFRKGMDN